MTTPQPLVTPYPLIERELRRLAPLAARRVDQSVSPFSDEADHAVES